MWKVDLSTRDSKCPNQRAVGISAPIKLIPKVNKYDDVIVVYVSPTTREINSVHVRNFKIISRTTFPLLIVIMIHKAVQLSLIQQSFVYKKIITRIMFLRRSHKHILQINGSMYYLILTRRSTDNIHLGPRKLTMHLFQALDRVRRFSNVYPFASFVSKCLLVRIQNPSFAQVGKLV